MALEAIWKVVYVFLPILSAFLSFAFLRNDNQSNPLAPPPDSDFIKPERLVYMFVGTAVVHILVLLIIIVGIIVPYFGEENNTNDYNFRVDISIRILVFLSALVAMPVSFLTGVRVDPAPPTPPTIPTITGH